MENSPIVNKNLFGPVSRPIERSMKLPVIFTMIILYQGLFSGAAMSVPVRLQAALKNRVVRLLSLIMVAVSATGDIEYAVAATLAFLGIVYLIKTKEEREKSGFV